MQIGVFLLNNCQRAEKPHKEPPLHYSTNVLAKNRKKKKIESIS